MALFVKPIYPIYYIYPLFSCFFLFLTACCFHAISLQFTSFQFNSLHFTDPINHNRNPNMGLCSSSNIELNPLAKQDVAEKLGVDVNEIVSHI